jgi:hypothetical protein
MTRKLSFLAMALAAGSLLPAPLATAGNPPCAPGCCYPPGYRTPCCGYRPYPYGYESWHGAYYHTMWGQPVALIVPPTAGRQTKWSWGVTNTEVVPIYHQFNRAYPGANAAVGTAFLPTPYWPSSTDQFGVYYVRGPW